MEKRFTTKLWPLLFTSGLFVLFFLSFKPALNSDDDFYFLYTLAGGHGTSPTPLLHYLYGFHPILAEPLSQLFKWYPTFNWYSLFLIFVHGAACYNLLACFTYLFKRLPATILFSVFFLFIESHLLLSLNYSSGATISALSGLMSLIIYFSRYDSALKSLRISGILLILLSGLLRVHLFALCVGILSWTAFFIIPKTQLTNYFKLIGFLCSVVLLFTLSERYYYLNKIPGWKKEETKRQYLFSTYNRPRKSYKEDNSNANLKVSLLRNLFLYDTSFITLRDISNYSQAVRRIRNGQQPEDLQMLYWTFINNRVYMLLFFTGLIIFLSSADRFRLIARLLGMIAINLLLYIFLFLFYKISGAIFISLLGATFFAGVFCFAEINSLKVKSLQLITILICFNAVWMARIVIKISKENRQNIERNRCALRELKAHSDSLFIGIGNIFPHGNFYIWDTPARYPLSNLIYKELILTNSYQPMLQNFGITDIIAALPTQNNIFITGEYVPSLKSYYQEILNTPVEIKKLSEYKCLEVFQLHLVAPRK